MAKAKKQKPIDFKELMAKVDALISQLSKSWIKMENCE